MRKKYKLHVENILYKKIKSYFSLGIKSYLSLRDKLNQIFSYKITIEKLQFIS